jgi:hypothetical protein
MKIVDGFLRKEKMLWILDEVVLLRHPNKVEHVFGIGDPVFEVFNNQFMVFIDSFLNFGF